MKPIRRQTEISGNLVLFCRFLRQKGYALGMREEADALRALEYLSFDSEDAFIDALRAILAKSRLQQLRFKEHYLEFWDELERALNSKLKEHPRHQQRSEAQKRKAQFDALKSWLNLLPAEEEKEIAAASPVEILSRKHFADLSPDEMRLMMRMLRKAARKLTRQKSRLKKAARLKKKPDLKRSIRHSMRRGGELHQILFSKHKEKKLKLVLLCDVSKSMELYSRFFIHLIYAFQNACDRIETFVFSTALHRVSELFEQYHLAKAYQIVSERVPQWSGGTTIGKCLQKFASEYGHALLDKKTVVLILSDGWDTGEPETMRQAMKNIRRASKKIIWLNPLAGSPEFAPEAIGMKTALPYIDVLESAHNLESLQKALKQATKKHSRPKT
ncbi:MAG TPA: VWA domain-containing protein [Phaeodactylibacter sp.]|nr:VWA domain-containing protein [Phaeodactylibacter sp.]